jgi:hypothetical protein
MNHLCSTCKRTLIPSRWSTSRKLHSSETRIRPEESASRNVGSDRFPADDNAVWGAPSRPGGGFLPGWPMIKAWKILASIAVLCYFFLSQKQ